MSGRKARVADAIRDTLAEMIAREVKDPRVTAAGVVSITSVEMNVDLSVATVRVSIFSSPDGSRGGGDDKVADKALEGLKAAAGYLRGPLARKLRLARPPELRFTRDTGLAERPLAANHLFIKSDRVQEQMEQVHAEFAIEPIPLTRCSRCNEPLAPLDKRDARDLVPPYVYEAHAQFLQCTGCGRIYWKGSHVRRMAIPARMKKK